MHVHCTHSCVHTHYISSHTHINTHTHTHGQRIRPQMPMETRFTAFPHQSSVNYNRSVCPLSANKPCPKLWTYFGRLTVDKRSAVNISYLKISLKKVSHRSQGRELSMLVYEVSRGLRMSLEIMFTNVRI